ncbi:Zn(II)2Cys6 transcription factor [bacterium]|nr:Zn(II)2Cys6 transcription factor [bacterium]
MNISPVTSVASSRNLYAVSQSQVRSEMRPARDVAALVFRPSIYPTYPNAGVSQTPMSRELRLACIECRETKKRCDRARPCGRCVRVGKRCVDPNDVMSGSQRLSNAPRLHRTYAVVSRDESGSCDESGSEGLSHFELPAGKRARTEQNNPPHRSGLGEPVSSDSGPVLRVPDRPSGFSALSTERTGTRSIMPGASSYSPEYVSALERENRSLRITNQSLRTINETLTGQINILHRSLQELSQMPTVSNGMRSDFQRPDPSVLPQIEEQDLDLLRQFLG